MYDSIQVILYFTLEMRHHNKCVNGYKAEYKEQIVSVIVHIA